ncbi:ABC transporter ATP-binding protein [Muricomes intestini]|jgi:energy-coupling factor transport system ATP-binding protein|uniref:ABC transporter ATP-binding protein n=1 Tax=Muricomes intestini TaxID=1796634 RepID=UPI000E8BA70C|nr:heme ABC transporter ATP-binding protein [Lachnospiraceae bacterium]HBI74463.1 heme ABC transporter ATP-binding protein [Lachnospiraceae bacterium]HCR82604.1 heme ABC transporter ATP-binding protein [Lachnospiraceae bacterium]
MNQTERKPVIEFEHFQFQYFSQAEPTLHDINLKIYEGEKVLIVGPSGSGKSTIGNCLNGLIPFSYKGEIEGNLKISGKETQEMNIFELSKKVGTVLQDADGQFIGLTVGEDVAFALENDCVPISQMKETVQEVSDIVDMGKLLKSSPFELSGGQKQRVSFAGVMVDDVDILLFDEPLANLDPATGKTAIDLIDRVWKESKKTVVIIEHRLEDVLYRDVDRIIVINDGRIVADMTPDELVAADVLPKLGIREPLYVTAMKYADIKVTSQMRAGRIDTLDIAQIKEPLQRWNRKQKKESAGKDRRLILEAEHLSFQYTKKRKILQDINFKIREGEMVSVVGTNGAGKSTLAKVICGFVTEDEGKLLYYGEDLKGQTIKERSQKIGFVMQNPNQMICKPMIYDEVALGLRIRQVPEEEIGAKVDKALQICGLAPYKKWPVSALSFGQKKRVTIASMLVMSPQILILDEPTAGQDYHHYTEIMEFLKSLNDQGVTIILITHDMHLMLEYTPHAIVISEGKKIGDASAVEILTNEDIAGRANLKITSLYELAIKAEIPEPTTFVQNFIQHERRTHRS